MYLTFPVQLHMVSVMAPARTRRRYAGPGRPRGVTPDTGKIFALIGEKWDGTLTRFADEIGCHPQTLWNIRNGTVQRISLDFAGRLAAGLDVPVTEIVPALREAA